VFKGVPIVSPDGLFIGGVSLAAVIVVAATEGGGGLGDLGHRLVRWRVGARWYAVLMAVLISPENFGPVDCCVPMPLAGVASSR
jgi:hypothetical protein